MLKNVMQAAALAAAVLASVPALAQEKLADVRVYYGDLDLSDPAATKTFDRRLASAVKAACPSDNGVREMTQLREISKCRAAKHAEIEPARQIAIASAQSSRATFAKAP
jgi:UrcA family protein